MSSARPAQHDSRTAICLATWQVVAEAGISAVSFRTVATAAGVSPGRVQHYFASKQDLLSSALSEMIDLADQHTAGQRQAPDGQTRLAALLCHPFGPEVSLEHEGAFVSFLAAAGTNPGLATILATAKDGLEDAVAAELDALEVADSRAHARELAAMSDGLLLRVLIGSVTPEEAHTTMKEALHRTLRS